MKRHIKALLAGGLYLLCNYFITYIPCWTIRKLLYRMCGMKIGKHSRIMMRTHVTIPWKIAIGENTTVNEFCYLDGRGGLTIGSNVNVALYSMLITGTHDHRVPEFTFYTEPIVVEDDVWLAARSIVLNGSHLERACIISAGSVVMPRTICKKNSIYCGVPAACVKERRLEGNLDPGRWTMHFR